MLAVSLGALAAWLGRISEVQVEEVVLNPNEPQYAMKGINGKRFDQEGRLKENLSAVDAVQYPNSADVHLGKPHLIPKRNTPIPTVPLFSNTDSPAVRQTA
ncbi:Uncharacterized protein conserved in bacteria [Mycobacteroides abscessus subsp. massiliense]|nr:Uncharacterized protein conserved in bacteria [Mycobacteroides abscessus subsp. massiliense]